MLFSSKIKSIVASSLAAVLVTSSLPLHAQSMQTKMQSMFNQYGLLGDINGPGAFKGQSMNLYVGGEMHLRSPVQNYQLFSYQLPHFRAGCGGVDGFLGSFSYINKDQFKQLLQKVGSNTVGLLFQSALSSISPLIASKLEWLQKIIQDQGVFNKNSCQLASMLVDGLSGATGMNSYNSCVQTGMQLFNYDQNEASSICATNQNSVNAQARNSSNPQIKEIPPRNINIVWQALKNTSFSKTEKEMFMNISGTYVFRVSGDDSQQAPAPVYYPPTVTSITTLEMGNQASSTPGNIQIANWMTCADADCLSVNRGPLDIKPFTAMIEEKLYSMASKIKTRSAPPTSDEIALVNHTALPVYKMLSVGASSPESDLHKILVARYSKVIAFDYAFTFLRTALFEVRAYLGSLPDQSRPEADRVTELVKAITTITNSFELERTTQLQSVNAMDTVVNTIQQIERSINLNTPSHLKNIRQFSAQLAQKN